MWILLTMIAIMPFEINPYLKIADSFLGIFPDFTMIKLLGLIGLGWSIMVSMGGQGQSRLFESRQARAFLLYIFTAFFAGIASGAGLASSTRFLSIALFLPIILTAVRTEENLLLILKTVVLTLILIFPYGYRQVLRFGGRFGVGLYEPNYLALALILLLPLAFVLAHQETVDWKRKFWFVGMGVLFVEILMTASRGAFVGLLVILPLIALRLMKRRMAALVVMACLLLVPIFVVPTNMGHRILASGLDPEIRDSGVDISDRSRLETLKAGIQMILANPLTGVGLGNFKSSVKIYQNVPEGSIAHNTYLEVAAELGIGALLAFLFVIYATFSSLRRSERLAEACGNTKLRELVIALKIGLAGYLVSVTFLSAQFEKFFWLIVFLSICYERIVKNKMQRTESLELIAESRELNARA